MNIGNSSQNSPVNFRNEFYLTKNYEREILVLKL